MMKSGPTLILTMLALLISIAPGIGRAADIGWPEAVGRLAGERSKAETCAALLKGYGDQQQSSRGQLAYGEAKANFDAVIAELLTALTEGGNPKSLPSLETDLEHGAAGLGNFCKMASDLLPSTSGQKGIVDDIVKSAVADKGPVRGSSRYLQQPIKAMAQPSPMTDGWPHLTTEKSDSMTAASSWPPPRRR